jgi:uncharacterized membrane protein
MSYELWKPLHIRSVILFLGNITTGLFWATRANKTRDFSQIASTFENIIRSDRLFTIPGVFGIKNKVCCVQEPRETFGARIV